MCALVSHLYICYICAVNSVVHYHPCTVITIALSDYVPVGFYSNQYICCSNFGQLIWQSAWSLSFNNAAFHRRQQQITLMIIGVIFGLRQCHFAADFVITVHVAWPCAILRSSYRRVLCHSWSSDSGTAQVCDLVTAKVCHFIPDRTVL